MIFDTGCTADVLRCAEGLFGIRNSPPGSCIKGVGATATITHVGQMLGIGRVFVAPEGANLISMSQLANQGASFIGVATLQVFPTYQEIMLIRRYTSLDIDICQKGF